MARNIGNIPTVEPFIIDTDSRNLDRKWAGWLKDFNMCIAATGATQDAQKKALLIQLGGKQLKTIWNTLAGTVGEDYEAVCNKLNIHFKPKKNVNYERFVFKNCKQKK